MAKGTPDSENRFIYHQDLPNKTERIYFGDLNRRKNFLNPEPSDTRRFSMEPGFSVLDFLATTGQGESIGEAVARILRERDEAEARKWREAIDRLVAQRNLIDSMFAVGVDVQFPTTTVPQKPGWQPDGSFVLPNGNVLWNTSRRGQDDKVLSYPFKIKAKEPKWPLIGEEPKKRHFSGEEY